MSREYCCETKSVILTAETRHWGDATATIKAAGKRGSWLSDHIKRLTVQYTRGDGSGTLIEVPAAALKFVGAVHMNRWEFRDEKGPHFGPGLYLVGSFPHEISKDVWKDGAIHFVFRDGGFEYVSLTVPLAAEGSWRDRRFENPEVAGRVQRRFFEYLRRMGYKPQDRPESPGDEIS